MNRVCTRLPVFSSLSRTAITNTGGCHGMGTLGNVPFASAHGRCTVAALSCIEWKAHHKFRVSLVDIWPISWPIPTYTYTYCIMEHSGHSWNSLVKMEKTYHSLYIIYWILISAEDLSDSSEDLKKKIFSALVFLQLFFLQSPFFWCFYGNSSLRNFCTRTFGWLHGGLNSDFLKCWSFFDLLMSQYCCRQFASWVCDKF